MAGPPFPMPRWIEKHVQDENKPVTRSRDERMAICGACEHKTETRVGLWTCNKCGCVCQFKTAIPAAKCPLNKW